jgi:hypothetical protein
MQDGAPSHTSLRCERTLARRFIDRIISRPVSDVVARMREVMKNNGSHIARVMGLDFCFAIVACRQGVPVGRKKSLVHHIALVEVIGSFNPHPYSQTTFCPRKFPLPSRQLEYRPLPILHSCLLVSAKIGDRYK